MVIDRDLIKAQVERALQLALQQAIPLVRQTIDGYLHELEARIGKPTSDLGWEALEDPEDFKFWYETGSVAKHIISKISIEDNKIRVVAGLPNTAPGYQEALWNEFGWSPHGSSKVVRRALFVPLAEVQIYELNTKLKAKFANMKLHLRVKI